VALFVRESGPGSATAIVFLHGYGMSSRMWQPQMERLTEYHCLAPDLPEQGLSKDIHPFTLEVAANEVADVIRARAAGGKAHLVGLSLGGPVVLTMMRSAPGAMSSALVSGSAAKLGRVLGAISIASAGLYRVMSRESLVNAGYKQFGIPPQYRDLFRDDMLASFDPSLNRRVTEALMTMVVPERAVVPTLVAVGSRETIPARQAARRLVTTIQGARGVVAPGLGHVWNLQDPDLFCGMVRAWVEGTPLPRSLQLVT
jgi:pimeloyl-ACP methyl ester carboxylesterase